MSLVEVLTTTQAIKLLKKGDNQALQALSLPYYERLVKAEIIDDKSLSAEENYELRIRVGLESSIKYWMITNN
ncbi:MAG: hypothetical protein JW791_02500 [Nanoarchaeota archaeon]|nr:hypothetical protein [Nanoarchaeota archaeon]